MAAGRRRGEQGGLAALHAGTGRAHAQARRLAGGRRLCRAGRRPAGQWARTGAAGHRGGCLAAQTVHRIRTARGWGNPWGVGARVGRGAGCGGGVEGAAKLRGCTNECLEGLGSARLHPLAAHSPHSWALGRAAGGAAGGRSSSWGAAGLLPRDKGRRTSRAADAMRGSRPPQLLGRATTGCARHAPHSLARGGGVFWGLVIGRACWRDPSTARTHAAAAGWAGNGAVAGQPKGLSAQW